MTSIGLAGTMAAGKTAVCDALRRDHGFRVLGFGDVVRAEAEARGLSTSDRSVLQTLGQSLIADIGPRGMVDRLLADADGNIAVDGVRHVAVLDCLRDRLPNLAFGFLFADDAVLDRRWSTRGEGTTREVASSHQVEHDLADLRDRADIAINTGTVNATAIAKILVTAATVLSPPDARGTS